MPRWQVIEWRCLCSHYPSWLGISSLQRYSYACIRYVAPVENMVGRIPLIPCFLDGNATPTIPHKYSKNRSAGFPMGCADAAAADGRRGSNVYEVNTWLWQFGRGKPRLGGLTIDETFDRQEAARKASDVRRKETRGRRKDGRAWLKMKCECDLNEYVLVHHWYILVQTGLYKVFPKVWRADMFLTLDCGKLYCACGTCILWYPSISTQVHPLKNVHVMQMVHTCMYQVHTGTYQYVQGLPKTFWGYSFVTFDYGLWYSVCWTCRQWCKKAKTVSKSMSNLHVTFPVHTWYIPVHTYMYHLINHVPVCTSMYQYVTVPGMYEYVRNTLISSNLSGFQMNILTVASIWVFQAWSTISITRQQI